MTKLSRRAAFLAIGSAFASLRAAADDAAVKTLSFDALSCMSWLELEAIYRGADAGSIPCGFARGAAIPCLDAPFGKVRQQVANLVWKGKIFDPEAELMVNRWVIGKGVKARLYMGESWIDGRPSIVTDYQGMSPVIWKNLRDEIREVCSGLYLGAAVRRGCPEPQFRTFFVLEACA